MARPAFNKLTQPQEVFNQAKPECCNFSALYFGLEASQHIFISLAAKIVSMLGDWREKKTQSVCRVHSQTCLHLLQHAMPKKKLN